MISDSQNIICILCNKSLKHDNEWRSSCECDKTVIVHTRRDEELCTLTLFINCLYFHFEHFNMNNPIIRLGNHYYDLMRKEEVSLFNNKNLFEILKYEINKPDYKNLKYLSEFYNSIIKYFIVYKNNMVFL